MRWLDHLRQDPEAVKDFIAYLQGEKLAAYEHFLNAKDMDGLARVKGRIDTMQGLEMVVTEDERIARDVTERDAQRRRAESGIKLTH